MTKAWTSSSAVSLCRRSYGTSMETDLLPPPIPCFPVGGRLLLQSQLAHGYRIKEQPKRFNLTHSTSTACTHMHAHARTYTYLPAVMSSVWFGCITWLAVTVPLLAVIVLLIFVCLIHVTVLFKDIATLSTKWHCTL